jgi:hypothetical protein
MYLIEYNAQGKPYKITPSPAMGLGGIYVNELPVALEELLSNNSVDEFTDENNKKYYIIKGE